MNTLGITVAAAVLVVALTNDGCPSLASRYEELYAEDSSFYQSHTRSFRSHGCAAPLFVEFGAYRGGNRTFSILGLASKPLHTYGHPNFSCEWLPVVDNVDEVSLGPPIQGIVVKDLPDYGYGRTYTVVVVTCSFDSDVGTDAKGGDLILHAYHGDEIGKEVRIVVLQEKPGDFSASAFDAPYRFDFLYCGSPLYGHVNPQRAKEWIAYHDMIFGERSHFILYDAGGVHDAVRMALEPWIQRGRLSIQNIRSTIYFDGYYYNQFLIVNDCLQRSKFLASWTFFFDMDEYIYVEPPQTLHSFMATHRDVTEISFQQYRMVRSLCSRPSFQQDNRWAFEKLTYRDLLSSNKDVKYVCNPRMVYVTGVHGAERFQGWKEHANNTLARYYHYHGTLAVDGEVCQEYSTSNFSLEVEAEVEYDGSMVALSLPAKIHEVAV